MPSYSIVHPYSRSIQLLISLKFNFGYLFTTVYMLYYVQGRERGLPLTIDEKFQESTAGLTPLLISQTEI